MIYIIWQWNSTATGSGERIANVDGNTGELGGNGNERIIHDTDGDANGMETNSNREAIAVL